jgi:hypothetical protein
MRLKINQKAMALAAIAALGTCSTVRADTAASSFTPGDIVVLRGGDSTNPNDGSTTTVGAYLDEYTPAGAYVGTIDIPQSTNGSNNALTLTAGGGTHEGLLTLSQNGNWLTFTGYDAPPTPIVNGISTVGANISNVTIGEISQSAASLNTSTLSTVYTSRAAVTVDGNEFYATGKSTLQYITGIGASATVTQLSSTLDGRGIQTSANNTLIEGTGSSSFGTHGVYQVGATGTLPTSPSPGVSLLTGSSAQSGTDFMFANEPGDSLTSNLYLGQYNVLYTVGGASGSATINKYEFNGSTFNLLNSLAPVNGGSDVLIGVTDIVSGKNVDVYYTDQSGIYELVDSNNADTTLANSGNLLVSAPANEGFFGIALAPTAATTTASSLTWNNTGGTGNGLTWDTTSQNWNNGSGVTAFSNGSNVVFNDGSGLNHYTVSIIPTGLAPGTITVNTTHPGGYVFTGTGAISGGNGLILNAGTLTLANTGVNTYGNTTVNAGTLKVEAPGALPVNSTLTIASGASVIVNRNGGSRITLELNTLSNGGLIDLQNNDLILHNSSTTVAAATLATIFTQLQTGYAGGTWAGASGIISSFSANSKLYTLGESTGTTGVDQLSVPTDVVVKYTYYGDTNLDGKVDGSDYSNIDNGFIHHFTGWSNGDFNYDGVVNGSDYTLIDNAFNSQGTSLAASVAAHVAPGGTAVPEPVSIGLLASGALALLSRRHRRQTA